MAFTLCFCFCLHAVRRAREREGERSPRTQTARTPFSLHKACLDTPFHCNVYSSHFMFLQLTVYCKHGWILTFYSPVYLCVPCSQSVVTLLLGYCMLRSIGIWLKCWGWNCFVCYNVHTYVRIFRQWAFVYLFDWELLFQYYEVGIWGGSGNK